VKLLDFGISKLMGSQTLQTQEDVLMGTPRYMAPEQAMGRNRDVDARSDIFAFGCMVYEMLCGDSPFAGGTIAEVVYRVVHEHPESLASRMPDLPGRAVAAVDRALAKNPKDRYPDVATFIDYIKRCQVETTFYFNGSSDEPLAVQLKSLYLKQELAKFAAANQGKSAADLQAAFKAFVARVQPANLERPTWKPGAYHLDRVVLE